MTTDPAPAIEVPARRWGGARPGAGAPRNNHNAARRTPREDLARVAASPGFRESLRDLPPALGELLVIALGAAGEHAIRTVEAEAAAACLSAEESDRAQRRATMISAQLLLTDFSNHYAISRRSQARREASALNVLRPWIRYALGSDAPPAIQVNQDLNLASGPQSSSIKISPSSDALPSPSPRPSQPARSRP